MPNLAGVYHLRRDAPASETEAVLARMARVLDVPSVSYLTRTALGRRAGCVNLLRGLSANLSQPVKDAAESVWLMLDGELYNGDELRRWLACQGHDTRELDDAGLCLALFDIEGDGFVHRLNGQFNLVIYHEPERTLRIASDRYGYRPLFVAEVAGRLLFALEMKAIIAALERPPESDGIGVLQTLRDGIAIGDRTWLDPIRVLDPGTILTATPSGVRRERYFRLRYRDGRATMSLPAFVDGFAVRLHRAAERRMKGPGRIGISLSGGLDSRSALLAIHPSHLPITAYTFGYPESRDVQYAHELAELLHLPHFHLAFTPGYLGRVIERVVWRTEGLFGFASTTSIYFHPLIAAHMDIILNGHCGDALTGSHLRPFMLITRSRDKLIAEMFRSRAQTSDAALRRILNPGFYRRHAPHIFDAFRDTFTDIDNTEVPNITDAWDMENRQRRGTFHSPAVDRYRFEQRTPFLDNELVDHLVTAPTHWRFQQRAYKQMILFAFPHAAHVPWAYTGNRLTPSPPIELLRIGWNFGVKRLRQLQARFSRDGRSLGEQFRDLEVELRADRRIQSIISDFARSSSFPEAVFDRDGILDIVERHWTRGENHTHLVTSLATYATAYRLLLFTPPAAIPPEAQPPVGADAVGKAHPLSHA